MDIDLLSKMVGELILDSDEVSLPGVGTFVAEEVPSSFSDKGYTINPPYRRLTFRQRESSDTGLIDLYASSNGVDVQTASSIMLDFLSELKETLKLRKTIVFPGLGRLRATRENNFFFVPDEDLNIYPEGFGLEPVSLKTHVETEDEMAEAVASLHSILTGNSDVPDATEVSGLSEESASENASSPAIPVQEVSDGPEMASVERTPEELPLEAVATKPEASSLQGRHDVEMRHRRKFVLRLISGIAVTLLLLLLLFILLAHVAPGFIDTILYSPEELELLKQI